MKKLIKRMLAGLLGLCLLLGFLPARPIKAMTYENLMYGFTGPAGCEIFVMSCDPAVTGTVEIPESINGLPVTTIGSGAFNGCAAMTELIVPDSITTIQANAFTGCDSLSYNLYDNGRYLGNEKNPYQVLIGISNEQTTYAVHADTTAFTPEAFQGTDVTFVTLPDGVTNIPAGAFANCTKLTAVEIPYYLTAIERAAFENCTSLTDVRLYNVEFIGAAAYKNCTGLTSVSISGKVTDIYSETFYGCESLSTVSIASGVTGIGESAFRKCSSLTEIRIPDSVTGIGRYAFFHCTNLTNVTLPDGITSIADYTFEGCGRLAGINIPEGVTHIGYKAFYQCDNLTHLSIPASVKTIDSGALGYYPACSTAFTVAADNPSYSNDACGVLFNKDRTRMLHVPDSIEGVYTVPQTVTELPDYAFRNCVGLTGVMIPENVTSIGNYAFYGCDKLAAITIPAGVTGLGKYAFWNCPALKNVSFMGAAPEMGSNLFRYKDITVCYPGDAPGWTQEVMQSCGASLNWQSHTCSYTSNGDATCTEDGTKSGVCEYCGNTITVTDATAGHQFVDNVCTVCGLELGTVSGLSYSIENGAVTVTDCDTTLTGDLEIPAAVNGCPVTRIEAQTFDGCTGLTGITVPDSVIDIEYGAFLSCTALAGITVAAENPAYSSDAYGVLFNKDQSVLLQAPAAITGVYPIPASVTTVEANAFSGCIELTTVSFPDAAPAVGENAFSGVTANVCYTQDHWTEAARQNYGGTLTWQPHSGSFASNGNGTCTEPGTMSGVCDRCGMTVTVSEPAPEHQYVNNFCAVCGERSKNYSGSYQTATLTLRYDVLDGKVTITGGGSSDGHLVIPDTIDGYPVTQIGEHAFSCCANITDVTIPNSVTVIGNHAFCYCTGLSVVVIPEGVAEIRGQAFYGCSGLTKVMIAGSVTHIGELAFAGCDMSRDIYFWGDAPTFSYRPFHDIPIDYITFDTNIHYRCDANGWTDNVKANCDIKLKWITYNVSGNLIYETVDDIWGMDPSYAKITGWIGTPIELVIPEKIGYAAVTEITAYALEGCPSLTGVTIPKSVTGIGDGAFSQCGNLTAVTFLGTAPSIGSYAFSNVTANAYHCCTDTTWTENVKKNYGGALTWVGHLLKDFETVQSPTCTKNAAVMGRCTQCGGAETVAVPKTATGHIYEPVITPPTCMKEGFTTYTCACGDSYTADTVPATDHQYENGVCIHCGQADPDYVAPIVQPTLTLKSPTLEFKDMITVNAMFTAENTQNVVEMGMITYGEKVTEWSVGTAEHVIPGTTYDVNTGRYIAHSQGIHAKHLGDTVYLACYAKLTDGSYVYTKLAPYCPIQYANSQLENSTDTALKQLVVAMLNYGSKAQLYFNHNAENLANAGMTAEQLALPESYRTDMVGAIPVASAEKQGIFANTKGFVERYPAITFEGAFSINYFFAPAYAPVDGITLYYWTGADYNAIDVLTVDNASGTVALEGSGTEQYRGDIKGISAKNLSEAVYVAAVYSDGTTTWTSGVLGYSIGAYCGSLAAKGGTVSDLAMATAVYGYHAKQYFT